MCLRRPRPLLAVFLTLPCGIAVAVWGESYGALAVGVVAGGFSWSVAVDGVPKWLDGQWGERRWKKNPVR